MVVTVLKPGRGVFNALVVVVALAELLPADKPRYLMGVGKPDDILGGIARGIDMFDCVHPTRAGRHGHAYTRFGVINLKNITHQHVVLNPYPTPPGKIRAGLDGEPVAFATFATFVAQPRGNPGPRCARTRREPCTEFSRSLPLRV